MIEIIPAIDLLKGKCVRLKQGDYSQVTEFELDPVKQALIWQESGASRLHLVDLDGAKEGRPINDSVIKDIKNKLEIPIQIGGGIRTFDRAVKLLNENIDNIILGTLALENKKLVNELADKFPKRIIIGLDAKKGKVATRGWISESKTYATDLAKFFSNKNLKGIIYTDISTDGTLEGPNITALKEIGSVSKIPITASGGIGSMSDLFSLIPLEDYGIKSVIVGRALYEDKFSLQEAIKSLSNSNLKDITPKTDFFS